MKKIVLGMILSFSFFISKATVRTWVGSGSGGVSGDISLPANWGVGSFTAGDDYVMTFSNATMGIANGVGATFNLFQSTALTFGSLTISFKGYGNALKQVNINISKNLTITNGFSLSNITAGGNVDHEIDFKVVSGTFTCGSQTFTASGTGGTSGYPVLTYIVSAGAVVSCTNNLIVTDGSTASYTSTNFQNGGTMTVGGTTSFTNKGNEPMYVENTGTCTFTGTSSFTNSGFYETDIENTGTLTLTGNATFSNSGSDAIYLENAGNINFNGTANFTNTGFDAIYVDANNGAVYKFTGNFAINNSSTEPTILGTYNAGQSTGKFYFYANVNMRDYGITVSGYNPAAYIFDGTGAQTLTCNNAGIYFSDVKIGEVNSPTVTLAGSSSPFAGNGAATANMSINNAAVLVIPASYTFNRDVAGGSFSIPGKGTLQAGDITGGITGSNFPSNFAAYSLDSTSTVEFNGAAQAIPSTASLTGSTGYGNLTLTGNTKVLGGNINVYRNFTLSTGASALSLGNFDVILKSNNQTTAAVAQITNATPFTYSGSGRFIAERYISSGRKWRFLSVPTDDAARTFKQSWQEGATSSGNNPVANYGMQITDNNSGTWSGNGFDDYSQSGPSVKEWSGTAWTGIASTSALIKSTKGYMCYVRGDRTALASGTSVAATTLRTKGQLYTGSQAPITVASGATVSIGNPYASAIDLRTLTNSGIAGGPAFYVWDPNATGSYGLGNYQTLTYNGSNFVVVPGGGSYGASGSVQNYIQSGQAFFVIGGAGGSVTFTEAAKAAGSRQVFRTASGEEQLVAANLFLKTGTERVLADGAAAFIDHAYSNDADDDDAAKMAGTSERVSILKNGRQLSVERRQDFTADDTIFLNIGNVKVHDYSWKVSFSNIDLHGGTAFFNDKFLNTSLPLSLSDTNTIDFSIANIPGSYAADRFMIIFKPAIALPVTFVSVSALRNNDKSVSVKWNIENESDMAAYDVEYSTDGRQFASVGTKAAAGAHFYSFDHANASKGNNYYRIKGIENSSRIIYSPIVKVNAINENASVSVYPNPVENKQISISFIKQEKGNYNLQLVNAAGQNVFSTTISINTENQISTLQLKNIAAGTYQLIVSSEKSKISTQPVFIK